MGGYRMTKPAKALVYCVGRSDPPIFREIFCWAEDWSEIGRFLAFSGVLPISSAVGGGGSICDRFFLCALSRDRVEAVTVVQVALIDSHALPFGARLTDVRG